MIQMMLAAVGEAPAARATRRQYAGMARKAVGLGIVASGLAVIAAQALQHALGG